jgi:hypothetical protein
MSNRKRFLEKLTFGNPVLYITEKICALAARTLVPTERVSRESVDVITDDLSVIEVVPGIHKTDRMEMANFGCSLVDNNADKVIYSLEFELDREFKATADLDACRGLLIEVEPS